MPLRLLPLLLIALALGACDEGEITVRLTDAPADDLSRFEIGIAGVDLENTDGDTTRFDFDPPRVIDLVPLRDGNSETLLDAASVDADDYEAVRLRFARPQDNGGGLPVARDNNDQLELEYEADEAGADVGFSISELGSETLLLDIDLRRSVREDDDDIGAAQLRFNPQMRAVVVGEAGDINGTLGAGIVDRAQCLPGVYVFEGRDEEPRTLDSDEPPLTTVVPRQISVSGTDYRITGLRDGEYTLAVTCDAALDDPESAQREGEVGFIETANVRVRAGQTVTQNFP